jgi:peptidyl-prolyl cis-trans isomerase B (cyclophilin B)
VAKGVPYQTSSSTNALAIISLIFGIISIPTAFCYGCGVIFAIVAIITGLIARSQIKQSAIRQSGGGLALTGLIIGSIVIALAIIGVLCYGVFMAIVLITSSASNSSLLPGLWNLTLVI